MQIKGPQSPTAPATRSAASSPSAPSPTPVTASAVAATERMVQSWRIDQVLQAVVRPSLAGNELLLDISGRLLRVLNPQRAPGGTTPPPNHASQQNPASAPGQSLPGNPPLLAGQHLQLAVRQTGANTVLRVLQVMNSSTQGISPEPAIRAALPRQLPLTSVLATLQAVIGSIGQTGRANTTPSPALPDAIVAQARQILAQLPPRDAVTQAAGLQQAIARSGIFLEAQLAEALRARAPTAETTQQLSGDLKGGLLGLLSLLLGLNNAQGKVPAKASNTANTPTSNTPPPLANSQPFAQARMPANIAAQLSGGPQNLSQLLRVLFSQVEGGLARIQLSQLASVPKEDEVQRSWLLNLPLRHGEHIDVLQIRIDQEPRGKDKNADNLWTLALAFSLAGLGVIHVRVTLINGVINATFWAEEGLTAELFQQHLQALQQRLQTAGLQVGKLASHHGAPPAAAQTPALPYVLLDVEA